MEAVLLVIGICIVCCIGVWIYVLSEDLSIRAVKKMRLEDERKATEEKQLVEKIRSIAHEEAVKDSVVVQRLMGNMRLSEEDELAVSIMLRAMKGQEK